MNDNGAAAMKEVERVCGWCGVAMGTVLMLTALPHKTHGACPACLAGLRAQVQARKAA